MRALALGLVLVLGTIGACLFLGCQTEQPNDPQSVIENPSTARSTPLLEVAQAAEGPAAIQPPAEGQAQARTLEQQLKIAETLAHQAIRPDQQVDAQLVRASLYDAQGRHEEANAALLHAGDVAASEAAATSAKNPASLQPTPEHAAALTVLSHAHREMVRKEFASARRHLNLVVDTYAETAPIVAQQALSDLQWIATQEGKGRHIPEAAAPAEMAGKRDIGDSSCHQTSIVPATSMGGAEIFANAVAGTSYTITASGIWAQDPDPSFNTGPNGFTGFGPIGGGEFAGMLFGTFAVREPGSSTWIAVGAGDTVTATADGPMVGVFADIAFAYNDNNGAMFVTVSSSECPPPPPAETLPPTAVNEASPETFYLDERGIWLDASLSTDNDTEGEDPAIRWYNWNLKNRSNPAQRAIIVEGQEALQSIYPTAPGEYDLVLTVTDNDGETASTNRVVKAVQVFFDPGYLEIPVGQTMVTLATVVPASAEGEFLFSTPNPETISLEAGGGGAGSISIAATGLSEGSTSILGYLESEPDRQGYMSVNVVPADPMTLPPTAIAATTTPVIAVGGTIMLDGSGSKDNDENGASIVEYKWTFENLTTPEQDSFSIATGDSQYSHTLHSAGEYLISLVVKDNEDDVSANVSTDSHVLVQVVGITFDPDNVTITLGPDNQPASQATRATVIPASAIGHVSFTVQPVNGINVATITPDRPTSPAQDLSITGLSPGITEFQAEVTTTQGKKVAGGGYVIIETAGGEGEATEEELVVILGGPDGNPDAKKKKIVLADNTGNPTGKPSYSLLFEKGSSKVDVFDSGGAPVVLPRHDLKAGDEFQIAGKKVSESLNDVVIVQKDATDPKYNHRFRITVLWVKWKIRPPSPIKAANGEYSADNEARTAMLKTRGTTSLGPLGYGKSYQKIGKEPGQGISYSVELAGDVFPRDFARTISIDRVIREANSWIWNGLKSGSIQAGCLSVTAQSETADESLPSFKDEDPQSGGSRGVIYDADSPGMHPNSVKELNREDVFELRAKFTQRAFYEGEQCSANYPWWCIRSARIDAKNLLVPHKSVDGNDQNGAGEGDFPNGAQQGPSGQPLPVAASLKAVPNPYNFASNKPIQLTLKVESGPEPPYRVFVFAALYDKRNGYGERPLPLTEFRTSSREETFEVPVERLNQAIKEVHEKQIPGYLTIFCAVISGAHRIACPRTTVHPVQPPHAEILVDQTVPEIIASSHRSSPSESIVSRKWYIEFINPDGTYFEPKPEHLYTGIDESTGRPNMSSGIAWPNSRVKKAVIHLKVVDKSQSWDMASKVIERP